MDIVLVRCKYHSYLNKSNKINECNDVNGKFDCILIMTSSSSCHDIFYIDWVRFLLYREHLIEVKE